MISTRKGEYFGTTEFNISIRRRSSHHTFSSRIYVLSGWAGGFYIKGITSRNWILPTPSPSTNRKAANLKRSSFPVLSQHFKMLFRNLIYTGLTRARQMAFWVGTRKALAMAIKNQDTSQRQTSLKELLQP